MDEYPDKGVRVTIDDDLGPWHAPPPGQTSTRWSADILMPLCWQGNRRGSGWTVVWRRDEVTCQDCIEWIHG